MNAIININQKNKEKSMKKSIYTKFSKDKKNNEVISYNDNCLICFELPDQWNTLITPCSHKFCQICFQNWFQINQTCPICKKEIKINQ